MNKPKREICLKAYITQDEHIHIKQLAGQTGLSISEYTRRVLSNSKINSRLGQVKKIGSFNSMFLTKNEINSVIDEGMSAAKVNGGRSSSSLNPHKKGFDKHFFWEYGYYQGSADPEFDAQFDVGEYEGYKAGKAEKKPEWPGRNPYPADSPMYYGWECGYGDAYYYFFKQLDNEV
ncbi:plasmid mobilization protein [Desulforhopalus singaporensis]|uniref:Ribbon-helix-helix protein, copG family n=1 Tax=Desulforhopalus singaporensis TaxID=91360 RepID=A0A1H0S2E2_9BACT|nr:hypothetical protein [Desulforhopalus singaporensis]SDP35769.1 hypothetical protein SAMN05660330_02496 [Desulforhopalus singaporensis]